MDSRKRPRYTQQYFEELLRAAGYKITPARLSVLNVLSAANRPLSAQDILEKLQVPRRRIQINYVTIYRSLNAFESNALVRRVPIERDSNYYELADGEEDYFICQECGKVYPFRSSVGEYILKDMKKIGCVPTHHSLQVYGICEQCREL